MIFVFESNEYLVNEIEVNNTSLIFSLTCLPSIVNARLKLPTTLSSQSALDASIKSHSNCFCYSRLYDL